MQNGRRPRHIRDIAHIYLSRTRTQARGQRFNIVISSEGRACFPGFHVANLAAAFSRRNAEVRIFELSGLLPNAGYYFAHPPQRYLRMMRRPTNRSLPGLGDITISFAPRDGVPARTERRASILNLIHLPPALEEPTPHATREPLDALRDDGSDGTFVLALVENRELSPMVAGTVAREFDASLAFALAVKSGEARCPAPDGLRDLGGLSGWEQRVADRVPVVLRDASDDIARSYLSVCDSMLGQLDGWRRRSVGHDAVEISASDPARP